MRQDMPTKSPSLADALSEALTEAEAGHFAFRSRRDKALAEAVRAGQPEAALPDTLNR